MPAGRSSGLMKTTQILNSSSLRLELVGKAMTDGENSLVASQNYREAGYDKEVSSHSF